MELGKGLSLVAEPMVLGKGAKVSQNQSGTVVTGNVELSYVELPLLVKYTFGRAGVRPYLLAGPTIGIKTGATMALRAGATSASDEDVSDQFRNTDLGLGLGGGIALPIRNIRVFVEGQYVFGLLNVNTGTEWDTTAKNRGVQLRAGLTIPIGARE